MEVEQPHTDVYIAYAEGQFLDCHVDEFGFGEANLILCLKQIRPASPHRASSTAFITADGYLEPRPRPAGLLLHTRSTPWNAPY